jgi:hypothetical protein
MTATLTERLATVAERMAMAAERSGRRAADVKLVAVSKKQPREAIAEAVDAGQRDFGENYVQELSAKATALASTAIRWHFIGHLQRNKARALLDVPALALIHGVDSVSLAKALDKGRAAIDVLVQVNVSGERSKSGCTPDALSEILDAPLSRVRVVGLMTMPPEGDDPRPHFAQLRMLRERHGGAARLPELSMGMSQDYEVAIEEGATLVRVGSAIFGDR